MKLEQRLRQVQLIISDVDGVLTDGGITFDNQGIETKQFHVRDGVGIKLWQQVGHRFGLLTGRSSHIVKIRANELGIDLIRQGSEDKWLIAEQMIAEVGVTAEQTCYVGDDLTDLPVLRRVGLAVAVGDAVAEVQEQAHFVTRIVGGRGAVRELVETILKAQQRWAELVRKYGD
jgi:YrbI family 3-deoxy-D-manno-octulosonate 8-phosphate phosphatase